MSDIALSENQRKRRRLNNDDENASPSENRYGDVTVDGQGRVFQGNSHDTHYHFHGRLDASEEAKSAETLIKELMQSLKFKNIDSRLQNVLPALAKTCQWLFRHKTFLAWNDEAQLEGHRGFLWLKGKPGSGKSTIMKTALQWARKSGSKNKFVTASYFFNARASADLEKSPLGLYRSLTYQILQAIPCLQSTFYDMFSWKEESETIDWTVTELQGFLTEAIQTENRPSLCMFIDALDEGDDKDVKTLVSFLEDLSSHATGFPLLKICLSSRHYPYITVRKGLSLTVEAQREHERDIETYVSEKLHGSDHEQLRNELCRKSAGIFLWVVLVVPILNQMYDQAKSLTEMTTYLQSLPEDLEGVFGKILKRDPDGYHECVSLLQWILYSTRPLSSLELYLAVQHSWVHSDQLEASLPENEALTRYLVHNSHGLVELTRSEPPVAQFIHETVREFLLGKTGLCQLDAALQDNLCGWSHARLAQACLCYFSQHIHRFPAALHSSEVDYAKISAPQVSGALPFIEYAVNSIFLHAEIAEQSGIPQNIFLKLLERDGARVNLQWRHLRNYFEKHKVRRYADDVTLLYVIVDMKLSSLAKVLAKDRERVNAKCGRYGNALKCACRGASKDIVQCLLDQGADVSLKGGEFKNPIYAAIAAKSLEILQTLLSSRDWDNEILSDALKYCAQFGWMQGIKTLSGLGTTIMTRATIHYVVWNGLVDVFRCCLERGADINKMELEVFYILEDVHRLEDDYRLEWFKTPFRVASRKEIIEMIILLLEFGAYANQKTRDHDTLLQVAARTGNAEIVETLLQNGVNVNEGNDLGITALHFAAIHNEVKIVKALLQAEANVNKADDHGRTPLHIAAGNKRLESVKVLLQNGANVDEGNGYGNTPLHIATISKEVALINMLLQNGANVNKGNRHGSTPLHIATKNGEVEIVKVFLSNGADVHEMDSNGNTVLHMAVAVQSKEVVSLLMSHGADINKRNNSGLTPLHLATESGSTDMVDMLLKCGSDTNRQTDLVPLRLISDFR